MNEKQAADDWLELTKEQSALLAELVRLMKDTAARLSKLEERTGDIEAALLRFESVAKRTWERLNNHRDVLLNHRDALQTALGNNATLARTLMGIAEELDEGGEGGPGPLVN